MDVETESVVIGEPNQYRVSISWMSTMELITQSIPIDSDDYALEQLYTPCRCKPTVEGEDTCNSETCVNFATQMECKKRECSSSCKNQRFQSEDKFDFVDVVEFPDKGYGLVAKQDIKAKTFLGEYLGEIISSKEYLRRQERNLAEKHQFVLQLKPGTYLDASSKGSVFRFINHSCEPNCFVEMWTVNRRIRVGVFAAKDISQGTELSFDYAWRLSKRPITKCYCGTKSCRGYLEILSPEELTMCLNKKKGMWTSWNEAEMIEQNAFSPDHCNLLSAMYELQSTNTDVLTDWTTRMWMNHLTEKCGFDFSERLDLKSALKDYLAHLIEQPNHRHDLTQRKLLPNPDWLVGKRVRIWWDGNQAYLEAKVDSYDEKTRTHTVTYFDDGDVTTEDLVGLNVDWQWLDETKEDVVIVKRKREVEAPMEFYASSKVAANTLQQSSPSQEFPAFRKFEERGPDKERRLVACACEHAHFLVTNEVVKPSEKALDEDSVLQKFSDTLRSMFNVTAFLPRKKQFKGSRNQTSYFQEVIIFGLPNDVLTGEKYILEIKRGYQSKIVEEDSNRNSQVLFKQATVMSNDWRHSLENTARSLKDVILPGFMDISGLISPSRSSLPTVSMGIRKAFISHTRGLIERSEDMYPSSAQPLCTISEASHAVTILHRALSRQDDNQATDTVPLLAACFVLACKCGQSWKPKSMNDIVHRVYCHVFGRDTSSVAISSLDAYTNKTIVIEAFILESLHHDIFVPNVQAIVTLALKNAMCRYFTTLNTRNSEESVEDRYDKVLKMWIDAEEVLSDAYSFSNMVELHCPQVLLLLPKEISVVSLCILHIAIKIFNGIVDPDEKFPSKLGVDRIRRGVPKHVFHAVHACIYTFNNAPGYSYQGDVKCNLIISTAMAYIEAIRGIAVDDVTKWLHIDDRIGGVEKLIKEIIEVFTTEYTSQKDTMEYNHPGKVGISNNDAELLTELTALPMVWNGDNSMSAIDDSYFGKQSVSRKKLYKLRSPFQHLISEQTNHSVHVPVNSTKVDDYARSIEATSAKGLIQMHRDTYLITLSKGELATMNGVHIFSEDFSTRDGTRKLSTTLAARHWPGLKQLSREQKKNEGAMQSPLSAVTSAHNGVSHSGLRELNMLQALHYSAYGHEGRPADRYSSGYDPLFLVPVGMIGIPSSKLERESSSSDAFVSLKEGSFGEIDEIRLESPTVTPKKSAVDGSYGLYMMTSPLQLHFPLKYFIKLMDKTPSDDKTHMLLQLAVLAKDLCHDLLKAIDHCSSIGIYFKWIQTDQLYVSTSGSLVIAGLTGAVYGKNEPEPLVTKESIKQEARENSKKEKSREKKKKKKHKHKVEEVNTDMHKPKSEKPISSSILSNMETAAPEIIAGATPSSASSVWSAVSVCHQILTGKCVVNVSTNRCPEKHIQRVFKILGTPKYMGFHSWVNLPNAGTLGHYVIDDAGKKSDSRERIAKSLESHVTNLIKEHQYYTVSGVPGIDHLHPIVEFFCAGLPLNPLSRLPASSLMHLPLFTKTKNTYFREVRNAMEFITGHVHTPSVKRKEKGYPAIDLPLLDSNEEDYIPGMSMVDKMLFQIDDTVTKEERYRHSGTGDFRFKAVQSYRSDDRLRYDDYRGAGYGHVEDRRGWGQSGYREENRYGNHDRDNRVNRDRGRTKDPDNYGGRDRNKDREKISRNNTVEYGAPVIESDVNSRPTIGRNGAGNGNAGDPSHSGTSKSEETASCESKIHRQEDEEMDLAFREEEVDYDPFEYDM